MHQLSSRPEQTICGDIREEKYRRESDVDNREAILRRVAKGIAATEKTEELKEKWEAVYYNMMAEGKAIGAGRVMSNAGLPTASTLMNCFVVGVGDSIREPDEKGMSGIYTALGDAAETMRRGGGVGYDFSLIRPFGAHVKGTNSEASGPVSYIRVFDRSCETVEAAGDRRGAQLSALKIHHPDIEEYVVMKRNGDITNFNMSVMVTDAFMEAVEKDADWELYHKAKPSERLMNGEFKPYQRSTGEWVYKVIKAKALWDTIMKSNYDFAEPGILFWDNINKDNNLRYVEVIEATNPCVTADTWVMTDKGSKQVKDLIGVKFNAVVDGKVYASESEGFFPTGHKQTYELITEEGYGPNLTEDHPVWTVVDAIDGQEICQMVDAIDLKPGDRIKLNDHRSLVRKETFLDGNSTREVFVGWKSDFESSYENGLHLGENCNRNSDVIDFLVKTGSDSYIGFFSWYLKRFAEVNNNSCVINDLTITTVKTLQRMLLSLGITSYLKINKVLNDGSFSLTIDKSNFPRMVELGFSPYGISFGQFEEATKNLDCGEPSFTAVVKKLVAKRSEDVYDVTIENIHQFDANGLVVSNCAEQPLPVNGCCCLGQIVLPMFVKKPFKENCEFDLDAFKQTVRVMVRFLNGVLDASEWPLPAQHEEAMNKRRIGLGFTGLGNLLAMMNVKYNSEHGRAIADNITSIMKEEAYLASSDLAVEFGSFPLFDADKFLEEGTFASRLPENIKETIRKQGLRNSHLLSIAPVGTISLAWAGNSSSGLEPMFSPFFSRKKRVGNRGGHEYYHVMDLAVRCYLEMLDEEQPGIFDVWEKAFIDNKPDFTFNDIKYHAYKSLPEAFVGAMDIPADDHLLMLKAIGKHIDSSMSKTVNVAVDYPFDDFKTIYERAHKYGLKGVATYRPNSILGSVLSVANAPTESNKETTEKAIYEYLNSHITTKLPDDLHARHVTVEYNQSGTKEKVHIDISFLEKTFTVDGKETTIYRPVHIFLNGSLKTVPAAWGSAISRSMSFLARAGVDALAECLESYRDINSDRGQVRYGYITKGDGSTNKAPMHHGSDIGAIAYAIQKKLADYGLLSQYGATIYRQKKSKAVESKPVDIIAHGKKCDHCGAQAVVKRDGCELCTECGTSGSCG